MYSLDKGFLSFFYCGLWQLETSFFGYFTENCRTVIINGKSCLSQLIVVGLKLWVSRLCSGRDVQWSEFMSLLKLWHRVIDIEGCRQIPKVSPEPQESTNPSKLSGIQKVKPGALSWLKWGKKSARNPKGTFFDIIFKRGNMILFWFLYKPGLQVHWYLIRTT